MKHKLSEIINTDCYVQFDSNEQLREWVKMAGIELDSLIMPYHLYVWLSEHNNHFSLSDAHLPQQPIYRHTDITIHPASDFLAPTVNVLTEIGDTKVIKNGGDVIVMTGNVVITLTPPVLKHIQELLSQQL